MPSRRVRPPAPARFGHGNVPGPALEAVALGTIRRVRADDVLSERRLIQALGDALYQRPL
jgi:hypothetical protein